MQSKYSEAGDAKFMFGCWRNMKEIRFSGVGRPLQVVGFVNDRG